MPSIAIPRPSANHCLAFALVSSLLLTFLIYVPGLQGPFVFDDYVNIVQNADLSPSSLSFQSLLDAALSLRAGLLMRPVSMVSFALNHYFFGPDAFSFKLVNLCIHLLNGILVFVLLFRLMAVYRKLYAPIATQTSLRWLALIAGTLWLVHPLNLTAILYVVQRETSLSALFMLAGVNLYAWARSRQLNGMGAHWLLFPGTALLGGLAVLSKESGALMPCYMLAVEACVFGFRFPDRRAKWTIVSYFLLFLIIPGLLGLAWIITHSNILSYAGRNFTLEERLLTETRVIWLYLFWTLLPRISSLSLYHDDIALSDGLFHPWTTFPAALGLAGLVVVAILMRRRRPLVTLGIAWFFAGQLMESTIFPLQIAFEHRNYLADLGPLLACSSLIAPLNRESVYFKLRYTFLGLLVCAFAGVTLQRSLNWDNPLSFAQSEARYHPDSPYATYQLGEVYANLTLAGHTELLPQTRTILLHSLALPNTNVIAGTTLVMVESQVNGQITPGLLNRIAQVLRTEHIGSSDTIGLYSLVGCYTHHHCKLPPHSLDGLFTAAFDNPYVSRTRSTAADLHVIYGNYLSGSSPPRFADARQQMMQAVELMPAEPQYRINVVIVDLAMKNAEFAEQDLQAVMRLNRFGRLNREIASLTAELSRLKRDQDKHNLSPDKHRATHEN